MWAAMSGYIDILKTLIDNKANLNSKNSLHGNTASILAAVSGHREVVRTLIVNGANIGDNNKYWTTAINHATNNGHKEVVELLIESIYNAKSRKREINTSLIIAIKTIIKKTRIKKEGYPEKIKRIQECIKSLIEAKFDPFDTFYLFNNEIYKKEFLKCLPTGLVITKVQIMQLGILGVGEEEIKSKEIVLFARRYNHLVRIVYFWGDRLQCIINHDLVNIIIGFAIYNNRKDEEF